MFQAIEAHTWYNRCKENRRNQAKTLHLEGGYDDEKLPFDPSLMVYFRKRLTPEVLGEINEMIVRDAKERQEKEAKSRDDDDDSGNHPGTGGNSGTMIVDATCAPSNIRYPQDVSLLN